MPKVLSNKQIFGMERGYYFDLARSLKIGSTIAVTYYDIYAGRLSAMRYKKVADNVFHWVLANGDVDRTGSGFANEVRVPREYNAVDVATELHYVATKYVGDPRTTLEIV